MRVFVTISAVVALGLCVWGDLAPGASSQPMAIAAAAGRYHCSIHPVMVGSVNQDGQP